MAGHHWQRKSCHSAIILPIPRSRYYAQTTGEENTHQRQEIVAPPRMIPPPVGKQTISPTAHWAVRPVIVQADCFGQSSRWPGTSQTGGPSRVTSAFNAKRENDGTGRNELPKKSFGDGEDRALTRSRGREGAPRSPTGPQRLNPASAHHSPSRPLNVSFMGIARPMLVVRELPTGRAKR